MTGSGINASNRKIVAGTPLMENPNGSVLPADGTYPAFAIATDGAPGGGVVQWGTDGTILRDTWAEHTGNRYLEPGKVYYVSPSGKLSTTGTQQVGVAVDRNNLRIGIGSVQRAYTQTHTVTGRPSNNLGSPGDLAVNSSNGLFNTKTEQGWKELGRLVQRFGIPTEFPIMAQLLSGGWDIGTVVDVDGGYPCS